VALAGYDIMLIPKNSQDNGIIIEFKKISAGETLEDPAQEGLDQIINKHYAEQLYARGITHIIAYSIAMLSSNPGHSHNASNR
jgi:PD-(D/E)XK nuclease superfamily